MNRPEPIKWRHVLTQVLQVYWSGCRVGGVGVGDGGDGVRLIITTTR